MATKRQAPRSAFKPGQSGNLKGKTMASVDSMAVAVQQPQSARNLSNTAPELSAVAVLMQFGYSLQPDSDVEMILEIQAMQARLAAGNLADPENMLMSQAVALQGIFASLSTAAKTALKGNNGIQTMQTMMSLALRAQSGSRATLQALGDLKFPRQPATFLRQSNVVHGGAQQVNNGSPIPHAGDPESERSNKLSAKGVALELPTNARTAGAAIPSSQNMATVDKVDRATVSRRQGNGGQKRTQARRAVGTDVRATARDSDTAG